MTENFGERTKKAFDFASDTSKQIITLSTAIITLSVTFSKDVFGNVPSTAKGFLIGAWALYVFSILCGLLTLMALTGTLEPKPTAEKSSEDADKGQNAQPSDPTKAAKESVENKSIVGAITSPSIRSGNITRLAGAQVVLFFLATILVVISGIYSLGSGMSDGKTGEEIKKLHSRFISALIERNITEINQILADEWTGYDYDKGAISKHQLIEYLRSGNLVFEGVSSDSHNTYAFGNTGIVSGASDVRIKLNGQSYNARVLFTSTLAKTKEQWQMIAWQSSRVKASP